MTIMPGKANTAKGTTIRARLELRVNPGRQPRRLQVDRRVDGRGGDPGQAWSQAVRRLRGRRSLDDLAALLASLGSPHRLTILFHLLSGPAGYQRLQEITGLQAGPLYYHIDALRAAGLLAPKRRDSYRLTEAGLHMVLVSTLLPDVTRSRKVWDPGLGD